MKHFSVQELVDKRTYAVRGDKAITTIDSRLIKFIDSYTEYLKVTHKEHDVVVIVNSWMWGGDEQFRGLRTRFSKHFSKYSQHSFGRALDFQVYIDGELVDSNTIRKWLIENREVDFVKAITFIEDGVTWVHVDVRYTENNNLILWHKETKKVTVFERV